MSDELKTKTPRVAKVFDASPPLRTQPLPLLLLAVTLVLAAWMGLDPLRVAVALLLGACAWSLRPRRKPVTAEVECRPGAIRVPGVGVLRAKDVLGATTARSDDGGVSLVLAHRQRPLRMLTLELADTDALEPIAKSLGIGHHGFGAVHVALRPAGSAVVGYALSIVAIPVLLATLFWDALTPLLAQVLVFPVVVMTIAALSPPRGSMLLTSHGLYLSQPVAGLQRFAGGSFVPFASIERVDVERSTLRIQARGMAGEVVSVELEGAQVGALRWGLDAGELGHLAAQIRAATERAHGHYQWKHEPAALADLLEREKGEDLRSWLARIDTLRVGSAGYRSSEIDAADLWKLLEDPEARPDVRVAASRMLQRKDPSQARVRIADVLPAVRDEDVRVRIAHAEDDGRLEEQERRKLQLRV